MLLLVSTHPQKKLSKWYAQAFLWGGSMIKLNTKYDITEKQGD